MDDITKSALAEGTYVAYTDGSCKGNPGPGGAAYRLYAPDGSDPSEFSRKSKHTTNNKAEMQAVIDALKATPVDAYVMICLDSEYIKNGLEDYLPKWVGNGWKTSKGKPVENRDRWEMIKALVDERLVTFRKIKAHSGDPDNNRVDQLAGEAANRAERAAKKHQQLHKDASK
ncbi:ribonuclease H [Pseudooceanicola sp. HF7]|uniref:ribonuclease H family protein n=1 Tax=Pseudooceanicola sp. HF7 TaxID=2721560 RepID=UPI00142F5635|nr:ribonuclease H [Pseudooceanicola sp. HF7]NIZ09986.1 ribonuclease HI [Pseudooceanicola sp. HF7]